MSTNALTIGISGLTAAQAGIATTGQNISNASTPGYTRQQIIQQANVPMFTGAGFFGTGTNVETVKRVYNGFLNAQLLTAQTGVAQMDSYQAQVNLIDNMVADPNAGLSPAMTGFFSALQELAANPASIASRQSLISISQTLTARFQSLDQRFNEIRSGTNAQIAGSVDAINAYAQQLGDINQRIILAQSAGDSLPANDLLDQRDQLISSLNKEIRATTVIQSDGSYSIFIGNGQPLVVGSQISLLKAVVDSSDPMKMDVALQMPTGTTSTLPDSQLTGGTLGGLLAFRNETLDPAQNALGRVAIGLAQAVNDQHKLGQDLTGALGGNYFNVPVPAVYGNSNNQLPAVAVAVTISSMASLTTSDYQLTSNGGGNYTLLRMSDNVVLVANSGLPASVDGLVITPAGIPPAGSSYLIQPTRTGARSISMALTDPRSIAIAAPISTSAALSNTGTASIDLGAVSSTTSTPPPSAITLRYLTSPVPSLDGFPVGATVDAGNGQLYHINSPTMQVPYTIGANISFNGIGVTIGGAPVNGDSFTINPSPALPAVVNNTGLTDMFTPAAATMQGASIGAAVPVFPLTITVGVNDQFNIALNGGGAVAKTIAPGVYGTSATLATAVQAAIGGGAIVAADPATGKLVVTSNAQAPAATSVVLTEGNGGLAAAFGGGSVPGARGVQVGTVALPAPTLALPYPVDIKAGINDRFTLQVDGGAAQTVIVPAGSYSPATLATQLQTTLNALVPAVAVTVSLNGANQLVVMSNTLGGASAIALTATANGTGTMVAAPVTRTESLPAAPFTITYSKATNTLSGFPVGSKVTIAGDPLSPYSITSTVDKVTYTSGATMSLNGISFAISGQPNDLDGFSVGPNSSGVNDTRNALLIGLLQTKKVLEGSATAVPTATFQTSYAEMVSQVGNKAREVQVNGQAQQSLVTQAQNSRDSVSAVNLDEEAANLIRYQQAYQASAKLISVAGKLFDTLLATM